MCRGYFDQKHGGNISVSGQTELLHLLGTWLPPHEQHVDMFLLLVFMLEAFGCPMHSFGGILSTRET